jgi:hypothetical protein
MYSNKFWAFGRGRGPVSDTTQLLELIEEGIVEHGGDLGGWTRRSEDALQLFDGRVTLHAEIAEDDDDEPSEGLVHAHVFATLHEHDDEVLDACLFGMGDDRESALSQAAMIWITCVAGPIRSFMDSQPVCMSCQAGVQDGDISEGYAAGDYGLPNLRAYVGPSFARGLEDETVQSSIDDTMPWFRYAAESAAPRRVHMVKATVISRGEEGWQRELEIDGHEVSHLDPNWPVDVPSSEVGYMVRYAVFEFPRNSAEVARRAEMDKTIQHFIEHFTQFETVDDLMDDMISQGFDPDVVHEVESISTIAFGRLFFEQSGVQYSPFIIRARRDGQIETDVPLMSIPAYSRGRAVAARLRDSLSVDDVQLLSLYNAESHAIMNVLESSDDDEVDLSQMTMFPCVVPDRLVSDETMDAAMAILEQMVERDSKSAKKPWWKFW